MIDSSAIIDPSAKLAADVSVGPYTVIGANVEVGAGTWIGPHVVLKGRTKIGCNNKIFQFSSIGVEPQDLKYKGEDTLLEIGDNNIIREFCTIHRGTVPGGGVTHIGNNNFIMEYIHIAHDCNIGNQVILTNNVSLAGHVTIQDHAILAAYVIAVQFCTIGAHSFITARTGLPKDVPPYILVSDYHKGIAKPYGLNIVGLKRKGFSDETIRNLKRAYRVIYRENLTLKEALSKLQDMVADCPEIGLFIDILQKTERGIVR